MSARATELGIQARKNEEEAQRRYERIRYEAEVMQSCTFQFSTDVTTAIQDGVGNFNQAVGRGSARFIDLSLSCLRLTRWQIPGIIIAVTIDVSKRRILVECERKDHGGVRRDPPVEFPLSANGDCIQISLKGKPISETEFADLLIEYFV